MPSRAHHLEFDEKKLKRYNVIFEDTKGTTVHKRMDKNSKIFGSDHRELDYWHSPEGIRDMIDNFVETIGILPETATDYVKIAYGHVCLDKVGSKYRDNANCEYSNLSEDDWREIYNKAFQKFVREGGKRRKYLPRR
jgi:hypothetical protein